MSILATYLSQKLQSPLYSNYTLKNSEEIKSLQNLWNIENGIICFDEMWITMDSRLWSNNVTLTRWINQTRKKKLLVFYTTQHINQIELRARKATDILIYTERKKNNIWVTFIDYQYNTIGRKYLLSNPKLYYDLYNTLETIKPLKNE